LKQGSRGAPCTKAPSGRGLPTQEGGGELRNVKPQQTLLYSSEVCFQQSYYPTTASGPPPLSRGGNFLSCPYAYKITVFLIVRYRSDIRTTNGRPYSNRNINRQNLQFCRRGAFHMLPLQTRRLNQYITSTNKINRCFVGTGVPDCPQTEAIFTARRNVCNGQSQGFPESELTSFWGFPSRTPVSTF